MNDLKHVIYINTHVNTWNVAFFWIISLIQWKWIFSWKVTMYYWKYDLIVDYGCVSFLVRKIK